MLEEPTGCARLVLLRHPELEAALQRVALGQRPGGLSRRGRSSVVDVLRDLATVPLDAVFTADLPQAAETAAALASDRGLDPTPDPRLRDPHMGDWEGLAWEEIARREKEAVAAFFAEFGRAAPPGGESLAEATERALAWWREAAAALQGRTAAVVAGSPLLPGLAAALLGLPLGRSPSLALPPSAFGILDVYGDGARMRTWHPLCLSDERP